MGAVQKSADAGGWVVGSSQGVRLVSGRGREGLPKASADAPPVILNSLHTDFVLKSPIRKSISIDMTA